MFINVTKEVLDLNKLNEEAKALNPKILFVVKFGADNLRFTVAEEWDAQDEAELNTFLAGFVDVDPEQKVPKIYDCAKAEAKNKHHHNINYITEIMGALIPKRYKTKGEVTKVEWYKSLDENNLPTDLILVVDITYIRDPSGFALSRITNRTWINRDGSFNEEVKIRPKFYFVNEAEMIEEGIKRRSLLVKDLQIPVIKGMTAVLVPQGYSETAALLMGRHFMDDYRTAFEDFKQNSSTITDPSDPNYGRKTIIVKLENEADTEYVKFLDAVPTVPNTPFDGTKTIRQYLISEFDI